MHTVERGFDWSVLLGATQAMSLFGERQLIELRIPSGKPGKEGADALKTLAATPNPDALMLVTLPRSTRPRRNPRGSPRCRTAASR